MRRNRGENRLPSEESLGGTCRHHPWMGRFHGTTESLRVSSRSRTGSGPSFRDYAADRTHTPHAAMEAVLAHAVWNKASAAYRRRTQRPSRSTRSLTTVFPPRPRSRRNYAAVRRGLVGVDRDIVSRPDERAMAPSATRTMNVSRPNIARSPSRCRGRAALCLMRNSPPRPIPHCTVTRARLRSQLAGRWAAPSSTRAETTPRTRERKAPPRPVRAGKNRDQVTQDSRASVPGIAVKCAGIRTRGHSP